MKRATKIGLCFVVVLSLGAFAVSPALANEGPFFKVKGVRLASGGSRKTAVKATSSEIIKGSILGVGVTVTCKKMTGSAGAVILGSNTWEPGTGEGSLTLSECTQSGLGASCTVEKGEIKTAVMRVLLVWISTSLTTGIIILIFEPVTGTEFANMKFEGTCLVKEAKITGTAAAEVASKGVAVKVGEEPVEAVAGEISFPSTQIKEAFKSVSATEMTKVAVGLEFGAKALEISGTAEESLTTGEVWGIYTK
jgi:hypothetical protein